MKKQEKTKPKVDILYGKVHKTILKRVCTSENIVGN